MKLASKATQPTMYFIGVTTTQSSIMKLFPLWAEALGFKNTVIKGIDIELNVDPDIYREVVKFIKEDELSLGALVTTHKINLYNACKDLFDYLDPYAQNFGELSSISKKDGKLCGHAKDPITSGLALETFISKNYWYNGGEAFILGAGGSGVSIAAYLIDKKHSDNMPSKIYISNRSAEKLEKAKKVLTQINPDADIEYIKTPEPKLADNILASLKEKSLIVNATGMGKDIPGSPFTDKGVFPKDSLVWEFNYRGELDFMNQASVQKDSRNLYIEDGWIYFIHGWTQVMSEVFHMDIVGDLFEKCKAIADELRTR